MNIRIIKIYKESFQDVRSHAMDWIRVASGPVILLIIGFVILGITVGMSDVIKMGESNPYIDSARFLNSTPILSALILFYILNIIGVISIIINGYRYAVLRVDGDRWLTFNLNVRFVKLILYDIIVQLLFFIYITIAVGIVLGINSSIHNVTLNVIAGTLLGVYFIFIMLRISLYQVAISVDQSAPLRTSWDLMKGNIWRLIGLQILVSITVLIIAIMGIVIIRLLTSLLYLGGTMLAAWSLILWIPFAIFILLLYWAANAKALGLVYKDLSKKK